MPKEQTFDEVMMSLDAGDMLEFHFENDEETVYMIPVLAVEEGDDTLLYTLGNVDKDTGNPTWEANEYLWYWDRSLRILMTVCQSCQFPATIICDTVRANAADTYVAMYQKEHSTVH